MIPEVAGAAAVERVFRGTFLAGWNTLLIGGTDEPLYLPADGSCRYHRLYYREDYVSSALHETAHWCIAGAARRRQEDFGYWYQPDGRSEGQQRTFERVEVKPQALEWLFSRAAGVRFHPSADNLSGPDAGPSRQFVAALESQAVRWCAGGLPPRARLFLDALCWPLGAEAVLDPAVYRGVLTAAEEAA